MSIDNLGPNLEELGIEIQSPLERKDQGKIHYVSLNEAIDAWREDPYGIKKQEYWKNAFGIDDPVKMLEESELESYVRWKEEGRLVTMIATQVSKPSYYFMTNVLMAAELSKRGIPSAVQVLDYEEDIFYSGNTDKKAAVGILKFPIGQNEDGSVLYNRINVKPYAIREDDGSIRKINSIDEANGYRCGQVLVRIAEAHDDTNMPVKYVQDMGEPTAIEHHIYEAVLGISIQDLISSNKTHLGEMVDTRDGISINKLHRLLFAAVIHRLREQTVIPDEETMPIDFVGAGKLLKSFLKSSNYVEDTNNILGFNARPQDMLVELAALNGQQIDALIELLNSSTDEDELIHRAHGILAEHKSIKSADIEIVNQLDDEAAITILTLVLQAKNLGFDKKSGLLYHTDTGFPDPASYYGFHTSLPDLYLECSSCGGDYFVNKVARAQQLQEKHGLPGVEVRIPDEEIPELEEYCIHPTGRKFTLRPLVEAYIKDEIQPLILSRPSYHKGMSKAEYNANKQAADKVNRDAVILKNNYIAGLLQKVRSSIHSKNLEDTGWIIPQPIIAWYRSVLKELDGL